MRSQAPIRYFIVGWLCAALAGVNATVNAAEEKQHHTAPPAAEDAPTAADVTLFDELLLDQDGRRVKLVSDVMADRIVVMNFIYTTCTTACPVLSAIFQVVQTKLGNKLGTDVVIVSLSVDPTTDTPPRLKAYAKKLKAQPGWIFLTGGEHVVDKVLEGLGAYSEDFTAHPNMTLIGEGRAGHWTRLYGFANPSHILAQVDQRLAARPTFIGHNQAMTPQ
ncbi:MAG: SCO family protein [Gammaproteobacteria bacterium]|nr:SCO family protein [Gammaproteobacteria bacterium]